VAPDVFDVKIYFDTVFDTTKGYLMAFHTVIIKDGTQE
jgi:hypothetical protein